MSIIQPLTGARRIPYVDAIRGYLIYSMTLSHLAVMGQNGLQPFTHKSLSAFFTGEGFMVISGVMMGYISAKSVSKQGLFPTLSSSMLRSFKILRYYIAVYLLCALTLFFALSGSTEILEQYFRFRDPVSIEAFGLFIAGAYRPLMFDILFLYILFIGISPLVIFIALRLGYAVALGGSLLLWLFVQYGLVEKVTLKLVEIFGANPENIFGSFPVMAWQFPFVAGLLCGAFFVLNPAAWEPCMVAIRKHMFAPALAICAAFAVLRIVDITEIAALNSKFFSSYLILGPMTIFNFIAFCVVLLSVLSVQDSEPNAVMRYTKAGLVRVLDNRVFRVIGSNTLLTFSASVVFTYWIIGMLPALSQLGPVLVINTCVAIITVVFLYGVVLVDKKIRKSFAKTKRVAKL